MDRIFTSLFEQGEIGYRAARRERTGLKRRLRVPPSGAAGEDSKGNGADDPGRPDFSVE